MMFFINNIWTLVIGIVVVVFIFLIGIKMVQEYKLNALLKQKHRYMRVNQMQGKSRFHKRMSFLTGTAFAPVAIIVLFLVISSELYQVPTGSIRTIDGSGDMQAIYSDLNTSIASKNIVTLDDDVLTAYRGDTEESISNADAEYAMDNIYTTATLYAGVPGEYVYGSDAFVKTVYNDDYYYRALENSVEITQNNNDGASYDGSQFVDSIIYTGTTKSCTNGYLVKGLYLTEEYLVAITLEYPSSCVGFEIDSEYLYNNTNVLMSFVSLEDKADITNIRLSGNMEGIVFDGSTFIVATKRYLPYQSTNFDILEYRPFYEVNGSRTDSIYSQISYIDGTVPSSYISLFTISITDFSMDTETLLTDYYSSIYMENTKIDISGYMYIINPLSSIFVLEQPIQEYRDILVTYDINNTDILKPKTNVE